MVPSRPPISKSSSPSFGDYIEYIIIIIIIIIITFFAGCDRNSSEIRSFQYFSIFLLIFLNVFRRFPFLMYKFFRTIFIFTFHSLLQSLVRIEFFTSFSYFQYSAVICGIDTNQEFYFLLKLVFMDCDWFRDIFKYPKYFPIDGKFIFLSWCSCHFSTLKIHPMVVRFIQICVELPSWNFFYIWFSGINVMIYFSGKARLYGYCLFVF